MTKIRTGWAVAEAAVQSGCAAPPEGGQVQAGGGQGLPWALMLGNQRMDGPILQKSSTTP